jgi:hypothetical protein
MNFQIRKAADQDIPRLMRLFNAHTAPPKSASFFRWWNSFPSVTFCAESGSEIAGMFVVLRRKLVNGLICGVLMGLIVAEEWRGRGLFKKLGDEAMSFFDDLDMFCCLTNLAGKSALENNFSFSTIGYIATMVKPSNASTSMNGAGRYYVQAVSPDTKFFNFAAVRKDILMFQADEEFRLWRFGNHPCRSYQLLQTDFNNFAVTNTYYDENTGTRFGDIADFEASILEEREIIELCNYAYSSLSPEADVVTIQAIPDSMLHAAAGEIGFTESGVRHFFCLKVKDAKNDYLHNASNWLIKWGDYLR